MRGLFQLGLCGFVHLVVLALGIERTLTLGNPVTGEFQEMRS